MLITLLDMIVRNRGGSPPGPGASALEGLLGIGQGGQRTASPPQQPQQSAQRPQPSDFLTKLFAGGADPRLSPEQNEQLRQQSIVDAGLGTIAADPTAGTARRVASGIQSARAGARERATELIESRQDERAVRASEVSSRASLLRAGGNLQELASELTAEQARASRMLRIFGETGGLGSRDRIDRAIRASLVAGDQEAADTLRQLRSQFEEDDFVYETIDLPNGESATFRVDEQGRLRNPFTDEIVDEPFEATDAPRTESERLDRLSSLSDDARGDLSDAIDVATAVDIGMATENTNPAAATTLFTMLTRAIDPGVSVREADIERGEAAATLPQNLQTTYNKYLEEGQLSQEQFDNLKAELERIGRQQQRRSQNIIRFWERRAEDAGVDPELVAPDPWEGVFDDSRNENLPNPFTVEPDSTSNPFEGI